MSRMSAETHLNQDLLPYQDPGLPVGRRIADLLERMLLEDKAGLLFHDMVEPKAVDDDSGVPAATRTPKACPP